MNNELKFLMWIVAFFIFLSFGPKFINKSFKNTNERIFMLIIIIAFFFSAPFVWYTITIKSSFGFMSSEHTDAWIGFFGSLIGGALTVFGVWWTIKDTEEKRKEDIYASHKPFLEVVPKTTTYAPNDFRFNAKWKMKIYIKSNDDSSHFTAINNDFLTTIKLKNVGLGIAKNIIFTDFDYSFTEITDVNSSKTPKNLPYELSIDYLFKMPYLLNNSVEEIPIIFLLTLIMLLQIVN